LKYLKTILFDGENSQSKKISSKKKS